MYAASPPLLAAAGDYRWLLDHGYPENASLKLVGDRHRLGREARLVLFRGVRATEASAARRALVTRDMGGRPLLVDAYNQLFAVMNYLSGKPVFISGDGLLRDAGAAHGRVSDRGLFDRSMALLAGALAEAGPADVVAWFDAPVPFSAGHARTFEGALREAGLEARCLVGPNADAPLKAAAAGSAVASADSAVADALLARAAAGEIRPVVFDAARYAIERAFGPRDWLDFGGMRDAPSLETGRDRP